MQDFTLGPWRVDPLGRTLTHTQDGARPPVRLSNKANRVLLVLTEAAGRVVTRESLLQQVWPGVVVGEEVLTHAIAELRRALGDTARAPSFVETVHKAGYRLLAPVAAATDDGPQGRDRDAEADESEERELVGRTVGRLPSIAVLPFANMSGDPEQAYFSDGISEDIITELARFRSLSVAARNASFVYREQAVDLRRVVADLGVDYVLEGSVRKLGGRVRITAQLADTGSTNQLWAERYDRDLVEIFDIQDDITATIVATLSDRIESAVLERARHRPCGDWRAYDHVLLARSYAQLPRTAENVRKVIACAERAIGADPKYAPGYSMLANAVRWLAVLADCGDSAAVRAAYGRCHAQALKAAKLNPNDAQTLRALGWAHMCHRNYGEAERFLRRSYGINPHDGDVAMSWVTGLSYLGRPGEAVALAEQTIERTPNHPDYFLFDLGEAHFFAGNYGRAVTHFEQVPDEELDECRVVVIAAFALAGATAGAARQAERYERDLRSNWKGDPTASLAERIAWEFEFRHFHRRPEDIGRLMEGLRKAGLPAGDDGIGTEAGGCRSVVPAVLHPMPMRRGEPRLTMIRP